MSLWAAAVLPCITLCSCRGGVKVVCPCKDGTVTKHCAWAERFPLLLMCLMKKIGSKRDEKNYCVTCKPHLEEEKSSAPRKGLGEGYPFPFFGNALVYHWTLHTGEPLPLLTMCDLLMVYLHRYSKKSYQIKPCDWLSHNQPVMSDQARYSLLC